MRDDKNTKLYIDVGQRGIYTTKFSPSQSPGEKAEVGGRGPAEYQSVLYHVQLHGAGKMVASCLHV